MENKKLTESVKMAIFMGLFLPFVESIRRIHQILAFQDIFRWLDDYLLGGILLFAAYNAKKDKPNSIEYLIAAWGSAVGALMLSVFGQLSNYSQNVSDPGIFNSEIIVISKLLIFAFMVVGLNKSIKANQFKLKN